MLRSDPRPMASRVEKQIELLNRPNFVTLHNQYGSRLRKFASVSLNASSVGTSPHQLAPLRLAVKQLDELTPIVINGRDFLPEH